MCVYEILLVWLCDVVLVFDDDDIMWLVLCCIEDFDVVIIVWIKFDR